MEAGEEEAKSQVRRASGESGARKRKSPSPQKRKASQDGPQGSPASSPQTPGTEANTKRQRAPSVDGKQSLESLRRSQTKSDDEHLQRQV